MVEKKTTDLTAKKSNAMQALAERLQVDVTELENTLKKTVFQVKDGDNYRAPTNEEFLALVVVANTYKLNPLLKELYAFVKNGKIIPIVPIDGWTSLVNRADRHDGVELVENEDPAEKRGGLKSVTAKFYIKGQAHPTVITEYMAECFKPTDTWGKWPRRMLRHKAYIQGARIAHGFSGIHDEDEAERIVETIDAEPVPAREMPRALPAGTTGAPGSAPVPARQAQEAQAGHHPPPGSDSTPEDANQGTAGDDQETTADGLPITTIKAILAMTGPGDIPATRGIYQRVTERQVKTKKGLKPVYDHTLEDQGSIITISTWDPYQAMPGDKAEAITVTVVKNPTSGKIYYSAKAIRESEIGMGG